MGKKTKKQKKRRIARKSPKKNDKFVVVSNTSYGKALRGTRIYYEGKRPTGLGDDGRIQFGKHILETLTKRFNRFRWIITPETNSITEEYGITRVRTSQALLRKMSGDNFERSRDLKNDIVRRFFAIAYPTHFESLSTRSVYVPGTLAQIVSPHILPRLSTQDKEAIDSFLPDYVAHQSIGMVQKLKATAQIDTLRELAKNLQAEIEKGHAESWWQSYIKSNILLMQQGYIKALDKLNVAIGETKFPDFCLVTHDNYLDILEIKKPDTPLLKLDTSRGNFFWDQEMSKAISQTENYIDQVGSKAAQVRSFLLDREKIDIKAVRPRGIILAGDARNFQDQKQKDDFRLLSHGIKHVTILTYDELLTRLQNYIGVLESFSGKKPAKKKTSSSSKSEASLEVAGL